MYKKVANGFAIVSEANKMNSTGEETSPEEKPHEVLARHPTQENNPPLSTKHGIQPPRLLLKDSSNPLSPKNPATNNAAVTVSLSSATANSGQSKIATSSHAKLAISKPQVQSQAAKVIVNNRPQMFHNNPPTVKLEAQKHKFVKEQVATIDISKDGSKRTITPTRKCK